MFVSVKIFCLTFFLQDGKGRGARKNNIDFLKASVSVPGGYFSLHKLCFPSHCCTSVGKIAMKQLLAECPGRAFFFFLFHTTFTACCSDYTRQHRTTRERTEERGKCLGKGLAMHRTAKDPVTCSCVSYWQRAKYTYIKNFLFYSWVCRFWFLSYLIAEVSLNLCFYI